jgi:ribosomal protein S18 acetylase RimI-like enzyme
MTEASKNDDAIEYRVADSNDGAGILTVLKEVAPEIPVSLGAPGAEAAMQAIIEDCCNSGESWVAVDSADTVLGFVLAKPDNLERFQLENEALSVRYIGVSKASRGQGISGALMEKLKGKGAPITASVLHTNKSDMANRLSAIGFTNKGADAKEARLRWAGSGTSP